MDDTYCPEVPGLVCGHRHDHTGCLTRVRAALAAERVRGGPRMYGRPA